MIQENKHKNRNKPINMQQWVATYVQQIVPWILACFLLPRAGTAK